MVGKSHRIDAPDLEPQTLQTKDGRRITDGAGCNGRLDGKNLHRTLLVEFVDSANVGLCIPRPG
jgi:hypothetical protein